MTYFYRSLSAFILVVFCAFPHIADAVTVGPVKLEYSVDPGTVINGEFYVKNEENESKTFYPSYEKFSEPNATKLFSKEQSTIALWIKTQPSVTLKPGEDRKIPFTITLPKDAPPGGHFAVVWWSTTPPKANPDEQVSIVTRAGILVYLNIRGEVSGDVALSGFMSQTGKKIFWSNPMPLLLSLNVENNMNIYVKPQGEAVITSIFGNEKARAALNPKNYQILPASSRTIDGITLQHDSWMFGPYKVSANASFEQGEPQDASFWIWVLPWKFLTTILVLIVLVAVLGPVILRKYNNWVIKQARKGGSL